MIEVTDLRSDRYGPRYGIKVFNSGHSWLPGFSKLRDFISTKPWEEQYRIGLQIWQQAMQTNGR
jgi:hypothetical protein